MFNDACVPFYFQHMIADAVRLIRQCQKDHMGQYSQLSGLVSLHLYTFLQFLV